MAKIVVNNTANPVPISDVGITVPASGQHVVTTQEDYLFANSDDLIALLGAGTVKINDGTSDISNSDGLTLIKGIFPQNMGNHLTRAN